ncbi:MAG TPA: Crp/Fnr family transcriptional regulator [Candidatus Dormibacteraeota bacterium]|nr:Crp/Fnr family transcriptional regulator [Candidatus Dormibacteraeota bacterium]
MDPLDLLARSELFAGASAADFGPLARSAVTRRYLRGDLIWGAGDQADTIFLVLAGEVVVSRIGPDGEEYVIELYTVGDVVGQLHLFEPAPTRMLDARSVDATDCWVVPGRAFAELLEKSPKLMKLMLRTYSRWIRVRDLRNADSSFRNVEGQVATNLLHLADRFGEASHAGVRIRVHVTETTLANMIGASRENVSRAIAKLSRAGDLHRDNGTFLLARPEDLRRRYSWVSDEEARYTRSKQNRSSG